MLNLHTYLKRIAVALYLTVFLGFFSSAMANPLFARQTALKCSSCHTIYPELTPFGRKFKLGGYTLGERETIPLALMAIVSRNQIRDNTDKSTGDKLFGKDREFVAEAFSLFSGGRFTDNAGAFIQWTYNNIATSDGQQFHGHGALDNTDFRLVKNFGTEEKPTIFGLTLHNNPTVQDVFNTTPAWSFPYYAPTIASVGRGVPTFLESGARVAGFGGYAYLQDSIYLEASSYQTAKGALSALRWGTPEDQRVALDGANPYWRLAYTYTFDSERQNVTFGHFGTVTSLKASDGNAKGDRFRDIGFDAQYQYIGKDGHHIISGQASTISEHTDWRSSFNDGGVDNPTSKIRSTRAKLSYLMDRTYGITGAVFRVTGDADFARFGSTNGKPDTSGYIIELNYWPQYVFPFDPQANVRFGLQYTGYTKFNGSSSNFDSTMRNAKDNNTLYLYAWFMF
ncbi:cytochrome C [Paraherbaspirillum soli]|uniref:Cytochrome C n=1 Tax=Paraherbaspirillum soli TaxID=631222 RepID=A0ABW0M620_9BURK